MFSQSRSIVMVAPTNPFFENKINKVHLDLMQEFGVRRTVDYGFEDNKRQYIVLNHSRIRELSEDKKEKDHTFH